MSKRKETTLIVVHCSATRPSVDIGAKEIRDWHVKGNGWSNIGYHFVIRRNGCMEIGRDLDAIGAHAAGFNATSVAVCMVGGLYEDGAPVKEGLSSYPDVQVRALRALLTMLRRIYPQARIVGHRDLSPDKDGDGEISEREWLKTCPGFTVGTHFGALQ